MGIGSLGKRVGLAVVFTSAAGFAQSREQLAGSPPVESKLEPAIEVRGPALQAAIPDIVIRARPPTLSLAAAVNGIVPFQLGFALSLEAYPTEWLRLAVSNSAGLALGRHHTALSSYAQAFVGLRILGLAEERNVEMYKAQGEFKAQAAPGVAAAQSRVLFRAWLPSYHAMFLEGGMTAAHAPLERCIAYCDAAPENQDVEYRGRYVFVPLGGLRYVYFVHSTSQRNPEISRRMTYQFWGHVIGPALNRPEPGLSWPTGKAVEDHALGGRAGVELPAGLDTTISIVMEFGYMPSPATALLTLGLKVAPEALSVD